MSGDRGFTYPAALLLIVITSISLMSAEKYFSTTMKREHEKELLFRGSQIQNAIESYYTKSPGSSSPSYPKSFDDLLRDNRFLSVKRHLRKIYKDPMTKNGEWGLSLDSAKHIKGVFSRSNKTPIKQGNFPEQFKNFNGKNRYQEWKFIYEPAKETKS